MRKDSKRTVHSEDWRIFTVEERLKYSLVKVTAIEKILILHYLHLCRALTNTLKVMQKRPDRTV